MIIMLLLNVLVVVLGVAFSWLPVVSSLPEIAGYDIDTALQTGVGQLYSMFDSFWFLGILFQGFLFLMAYYIVKMVVRFFFGHRAG